MTLLFACPPDNDLYCVLERAGHAYTRCAGLGEALQAAPPGAGVLALADSYPRPAPGLDETLARLVKAKGLRLYLEYPASLPDLKLGDPRPTQWERVVVASEFFAPAVEQHTLLAQHGCWFLPVETEFSPDEALDVALAVTRVAGYDRALYGLPPEAHPILFALPGASILVAASTLSQFIRGRYGPQRAWKAIWERLLAWAGGSDDHLELDWTPAVRTEEQKSTD